MTIKIFTVFVISVVHAVLAQNGRIGYDYRTPAVPFQLSSNLEPNMNPQQLYYNNAHESQNGFVPSAIYHQHYTDGIYKNQHLPTHQTSHYQGYQTQSSYQNGNNNVYNQNSVNGNLLGVQNAQQTVYANSAYNPSLTNSRAQQPVITKHIYFHLPPPDDSATAAPASPNSPKKTYNIVFIKLPSQRSTSAARLQQLINQQATVESKTLIYVLVKKPESRPTQPVTSKPEVFFVKYKDPKNVANSDNSGSTVAPVLQGSTSGLLPGKINGYGYK